MFSNTVAAERGRTASRSPRHFRLVATEGVTGGAVYDAVVAATAGEAGAMLQTLDRRAIPTYQLLQIDYKLLA